MPVQKNQDEFQKVGLLGASPIDQGHREARMRKVADNLFQK
jgi:hypothetical protein